MCMKRIDPESATMSNVHVVLYSIFEDMYVATGSLKQMQIDDGRDPDRRNSLVFTSKFPG